MFREFVNNPDVKEFADLLFQAGIPFKVTYRRSDIKVKISHCLTAKLVYVKFEFNIPTNVVSEHVDKIMQWKSQMLNEVR